MSNRKENQSECCDDDRPLKLKLDSAKKFFKCLTARNYFQGLLEHSKEYNRLLENAKKYYQSSCEESVKPNQAKEISDLLEKLEIDTDELKEKEKCLPESDKDDWMNITQEDLDAMLETRFGRASQVEGDLINGTNNIADHLKTFINHISGLEGAEFPKYNLFLQILNDSKCLGNETF